MSIPATQKAVVFESIDCPLTVKCISVPKIKATEILVKIAYTGVCHSDLHAWKGDWPIKAKLPLVGGHEGAGIVVAKGSEVTNFEIGDNAGIKWLNGNCFDCDYCYRGYEACCSQATLSGYTCDGTFQEYAVANAKQAARIPKGTDLASVAPILCAGVTVYRALTICDAVAGQWVAVCGAGGGLGTMAVQYAKALGYKVLAIDGGDSKKDHCLELGADVFVDFTKIEDVSAEVKKITEGGAHAVVNVSVSEKAMCQSVEYVRLCGTVVFVGLPSGAEVRYPLYDQVCRYITLKGTSVANVKETEEALDIFAKGLIKSPIKVVGLDKLADVFELMDEGKILGRYVIDMSL
ncbi:unnamed protein product [Kuraishia capsulata CBS 1993]|uniref:alcohol dehydrogenase n=1 Tax=Kuraishia capsulata CBS 1993 TaxID=1382522 RepID=W6MR56_9ASCO|nr:uncharacterized protein KUCA_T00005202001 [Kuraishia capsulata CBS 1993]CDK29214.1 unnamed protein product [Kuraishia capsulata CBS 1993]